METDTIACAGGLFLARDTKRFLLLLRTKGKTAGTWGVVGGKKDPIDVTPYDILIREVSEEIGKTSTIEKTIPLESFTSRDQKFYYNTYVILVDKEFIPVLNDEHCSYAWCSLGNWPKPLHHALRNSLHNRIIKEKLKLILEII
jgi:8-oxo-dGTP pyrophosphatase MutT (NUDIX family)